MMEKRIEDLFRRHGGHLRMSQALDAGFSRSAFYSLRDKGKIVPVSRGLYRLAERPDHQDPDLCIVSLRYPRAVVCLISALSFHDMTTQVPHVVSIALPRGSRAPRLDAPPVHPYFFSGPAYEVGIEEQNLDGVRIRVYDREKTLVDVFRFRNKLGIDVFLEALALYRDGVRTKPALLMDYARICGVEMAIRPYLEASL